MGRTMRVEEDVAINMEDVVKLKEVLYLLDDDEVEVVLDVLNCATRSFEPVSIMRRNLSLSTVKDVLARKGLPCDGAKKIYHKMKAKVTRLLVSNLQNGTNVGFSHRFLGWSEYHGELVFKADRMYTETEVIQSKYAGIFNIKSNGSIDVYKKMLQDCVVGNIPLEAICAMAAAATVLAFAKVEWKMPYYNVINHLAGTSSLGKTTATELFVSFGSIPDGSGTLKQSFLSTLNAIMKKLTNIQGYPCAVDECSLKDSNTDFTEFVYAVANGTGKVYCYAGGSKVSEEEHFATVLLTNGEGGMLRKCKNNNEGLRVRLFEYPVESWTRSAFEANNVKTVSLVNYGLVTPLVGQELLQSSLIWKERLTSWQNKVKQRIQEENIILGIGDRIADYVALYVTSLELLNQVLNMTFNVDEVYEFFYMHIIVANAEEANMATRAHDAVQAYYSMHVDQFVDEVGVWNAAIGENSYRYEEGKIGIIVGASRSHKVGKEEYNCYIIFYPNQLEKILEDSYFADPDVAIREMRKSRLLRTKDRNRDYMEVDIEGSPVKAKAVWVKNTYY